MKKSFSSVIFLTILFIFLVSIYGSLKAEKIKIKTENGVTVVYNPKKPAPPKGVLTKLVLKEDFSIGEGEQEEEMFSEMTAVEVDKKGNIYILDRKESMIKVFDSKGKYVRTIGKKGQGPGEVNQPVGIRITPNNELLVEDVFNQRLAVFALDGKFLKNVSTAKALGLAGIAVDSQGNIIGQQVVPSENKLIREVKKYGSDLNPLFTIVSSDFPNILEGKINIFRFLIFYVVGKEDHIFYGNPEEYEIKIFNSEGKLVKKILKEWDAVKVTKEDEEDILARIPDVGGGFKDRLEFPKLFPAYQSFSLDEQERLLVRTFEKGKKKDEYFFDVFDVEGKYIAKILLKGELRVWKGKKLYAIDETEDGFMIFKCYSVDWEK